MSLSTYLNSFSSLFFPQACVGCDKPLTLQEKLICTDCWFHLPYTNYHLEPENNAARQLWGKAKIDFASAFVFYRDASRVKEIMYHFKYRNMPEIGELLGRRYGQTLCEAALLKHVDIIIPVPLHQSKLRKRGYNQSRHIAIGLSEALEKPVWSDCLVRTRTTDSQTRKSRFERHEGMQDTFMLVDADRIKGKHILLVDDVLTTGATFEACANTLTAGRCASVSVVAICRAQS